MTKKVPLRSAAFNRLLPSPQSSIRRDVVLRSLTQLTTKQPSLPKVTNSSYNTTLKTSSRRLN